ncbi:PrsW family intramembrane metalloprotease [Streptomyces hoynatensis]|uniref:Protease PrsW n=1 Tax=Streptomyces hoynatensis TaxID=1141874 RepID=A0A3A9YTZ3_9ACTN|nr:PrsW family intramembrane metalloprotease [Streptomyces hoynatensis]RKN39445.1 protease PrsW [Streptomyces hoynatensis]
MPPLPAPRASPRTTTPRSLAVGALLTACGVGAGLLVGRETGGAGFAAGLGLALLPLPFLFGVFWWMDAVIPKPRRAVAFAFGWGSCAATLFALLVNGLVTKWLTGDAATMTPEHADTLELTVVAPMVEESAKAAAVLLLFVHRPRAFHGVLAGVLAAGVTATGFAFTENILYLGGSFAEDREAGVTDVLDSQTVLTFVVRVVLAPLAHPMFTALTGLGFGLATALAPGRRAPRIALPLLGLAAAMGLHSAWNASTSLSFTGFALVYGLLMLPVFALLSWLVVWARRRQLQVLRLMLPVYAEAGWLGPEEPAALTSLRARRLSRRMARRRHGAAGARAVAAYQSAALAVALLRDRAERGAAGPGFAEAEGELLRSLWQHRALAAAPIAASAPGPFPPEE